MALLSSRFQLFDLEDVEALVVSAVNRSRHAGDLSPDDRDDLVAAGIAAVWKASATYDRSRGKFSTVAWVVAQRTVVDTFRRDYRTVWKFRDRVHERPRPVFVSLDDERNTRLGDALGARAGDPASDWDEAVRGLQRARDRTRARDLDTLNLRPRGRAAG